MIYNFFILLLAAAPMVTEDNKNKKSQIIEHGDIFSSIDLKLELKK
jgi:hypothetical protein